MFLSHAAMDSFQTSFSPLNHTLFKRFIGFGLVFNWSWCQWMWLVARSLKLNIDVNMCMLTFTNRISSTPNDQPKMFVFTIYTINYTVIREFVITVEFTLRKLWIQAFFPTKTCSSTFDSDFLYILESHILLIETTRRKKQKFWFIICVRNIGVWIASFSLIINIVSKRMTM